MKETCRFQVLEYEISRVWPWVLVPVQLLFDCLACCVLCVVCVVCCVLRAVCCVLCVVCVVCCVCCALCVFSIWFGLFLVYGVVISIISGLLSPELRLSHT